MRVIRIRNNFKILTLILYHIIKTVQTKGRLVHKFACFGRLLYRKFKLDGPQRYIHLAKHASQLKIMTHYNTTKHLHIIKY